MSQTHEPSWLWTTVKTGLIGGAAVAGVAYADEIGDALVSISGEADWAKNVDEVLNKVSGYAVSAGDKINDNAKSWIGEDGAIGKLGKEHTDKLTAIIAATVGAGALGAIVKGMSGSGQATTTPNFTPGSHNSPNTGR